MSFGVNIVIVSGNLVKDLVLQEVNGGKFVCNGTIANNRLYTKSDGEKKKETAFIDIEAWDQIAKAMVEGKGAQKGDLLLVEGRLTQDQWTTTDGATRSKIKIAVDKFSLFKKQPKPAEVPDQTNREDPKEG